MKTRRRPLTEDDLQRIREQWGDDKVVNSLLWEIARLRDSVRIFYKRTVTLHSYFPRETIVPDNPEVDSLLEREPAINDHATKQRGALDFDANVRELKRKAREVRG